MYGDRGDLFEQLGVNVLDLHVIYPWAHPVML